MKKFKMIKGTARIASTSGHIMIIGQDYVEVPEHMESDAMAAGCISEEMFEQIKSGVSPEPAPLTDSDRMDKIVESIKVMYQEDTPDNFTRQGLPDKRTLAGKCGFKPTTEEFDAAWEVISKG